uniref:Abnormal cell migration protein 10 n=2 Tax=Parascaris univalens TaxID=6257 RepID=A0A915BIG9_PARUN
SLLKEFDSDVEDDDLDSDEDVSDVAEKSIILLSSLLNSGPHLESRTLCATASLYTDPELFTQETTLFDALPKPEGIDIARSEKSSNVEDNHVNILCAEKITTAEMELVYGNVGSVGTQPHPGGGHQQHQQPSDGGSAVAVDTQQLTQAAKGGVKVRPRPQVPPKPQMDAVRYSMANVQESCDWELDTLLSELSALESQLNSSAGGDQLLLGLPMLPVSTSKNNSANLSRRNSTLSTSTSTQHTHSDTHKRFGPLSEECMRPIASSSDCPSPDRDSAFGDSSSTESRNRCRNSAISSSDSCRGSLNTPSPTQQASPNLSSSACSNVENAVATQPQPLSANEIKAAKIREALEKMREADIKKLYVKFFLGDGSATVSILVDERWTVAEVMRHIADKVKVTLTEQHAIVEEYPELFIKRIYEDNEFLVENIMMWTLNSQNRLYFTRRPDKYSFMERPEEYLLSERSIDLLARGAPSPETKRHIVKEFFENDNVQPPEIEGWLMLKADGKKSWKKHFFVLRPSGLYYCSKGKSRNSKDLQCLMNMQTNQAYTCTEWRRKYKAPTNFGFAIKHPKIQVKASKYIKYVCTEDAATLSKWMVALRIAKNGRQLYDNYIEARKRMECTLAQPVKVEIPQVVADCRRISAVGLRKTRQDPAPLLNLNRDSKNPPSICSRMSTSTVNNETCSSSHNSIVFDQSDDVVTGTIKRAPCDVQAQYRRQSSQVEMCGSGSGSPSVYSAPDATADSDSDEEQFPPPPPTVMPASCHEEPLKMSSGGMQQIVFASTPNVFSNGGVTPLANPNVVPSITGGNYTSASKPQVAPIPPTKPHITPSHMMYSSASFSEEVITNAPLVMHTSNVPRKVPPPPPPKRADSTRLHNAATDALHSELEMVMARRLQRIEQH